MTSPTIIGLLRAIDVDRALVWGLSGKIWSGLAAPVTAILIARCFSPEEQGYYYTFISLLAVQLVVELGLSSVIAIFASHEWSKLSVDGDGHVGGDQNAKSRLRHLLGFGLRWFATGGLILAVVLTGAGFWFFGSSERQTPVVSWAGPWILLCVATVLNIVIAPVWAILQGCNQIKQLNVYRLAEGVLRSLVMWGALLAGAGLWSAAMASLVVLPWAAAFLWVRYRNFLGSLVKTAKSSVIDWRRDLLPMQWRIAVSWLSGLLMFSLFTPALFHFQGSIVAGQMGMSLSLVGGIAGLAGTWIQVKTPRFAILIAGQHYGELDREVRKAGTIAFAAAVAGGLFLIGLVLVLEHWTPQLRARLLPLLPIAILIAAEALHQISAAQSSYLRAFKREPFMLLSLTTGVIVAMSTIICSKYFGPMGVAAAYLASMILALVWGCNIVSQWRHHLRTS